jgi:hypothetical protein
MRHAEGWSACTPNEVFNYQHFEKPSTAYRLEKISLLFPI